MRASLLSLLLSWATFNVHADDLLPRSTSPDGRAALFYRQLPSAYSTHGYEFYLRDLKTHSPLSDQLIPHPTVIDNARLTTDSSTELLFTDIGREAEAARHGERRDAAFNYAVVWSPDSRRVAVEGGAHKFWHLAVYHRVDNSFQAEELPSYEFTDYFRAPLDHPKVKEVGMRRRLRERNGEFPDSVSYVCWLSNTVLAVNTFPYLLREEDYYNKLAVEPFFMLDFKVKPTPSILGYCR